MGAEAIVGIVLLALMLGIIYGPWQWVCTDAARQALFEGRDAIFDMARAGKLSFECEDYKIIRSSMEALIRYAHEMTVPRLMWLMVCYGRLGKTGPSELYGAIQRIQNTDVREEVIKHVAVATRSSFRWMIYKSPGMVVVLLLLLLIRRISPKVGSTQGVSQRAVRVVQNEAEAVEHAEIAA